MSVERLSPPVAPGEMLERRVLDALGGVLVGPDGPDVVTAGHVYDVVATGGIVRVLVDPDRIPGGDADALADAVGPILRGVDGVERVVVKPRPTPMAGRRPVPGVQRVVAVHSGKGGVGKSTVAVNLAAALARNRGNGQPPLRIGLLDADVYGPSAPMLLGVSKRAAETEDGSGIAPVEAHGLKAMSLGFLMPEGKALAWRGGLVDEGLPQLLTDVAWGDLDVLIVDLPPGTSDVHLALAGHVDLAGVLTVTAPGQISVQDVRRGMEMFADVGVPCLGIIENFAGVACRRCGHTEALFGAGGGDELARETGLPLLARLPFLPEVEATAAEGVPVSIARPTSEAAAIFRDLADRVRGCLQLRLQETAS